MASISALTYKDSQSIFDDIDRDFRLQRETLMDLTKTFLNEFKAGLESYNQPMAMMYAAFIFYIDASSHSLVDLRSSQVFPTVQKRGTG